MKRARPILYGSIILILILIVVGKFLRQAKNDSMQDAYSSVVTVKGFVLQPETFVRHIEETGVLSGYKEAMVAAETGGRVLNIKVDVGDMVRAGQPLVRLDDELYQLESERAKIAFDKAKMDLDRIQKLYDQKSVSETDLENAKLGVKGAEVQYRLALKTYHDATIAAPFTGTVAARLTEEGQMIERGMPVIQLVDISSLKLTVQVTESDLKYLSIDAVTMVIVEAAGDTVQGKVTAIGSRATTGSRTFPVEIKIPGNNKLRSGMFARAIISASTVDNGMLLPRAALLPDMGNTVVYIDRNSSAHKVIIRTIGTAGDNVAVEGLSPGDTVITTGNQSVAEGTKLNLILESRRPQ
jgi:membrane fusion protein, multidrug efflux system